MREENKGGMEEREEGGKKGEGYMSCEIDYMMDTCQVHHYTHTHTHTHTHTTLTEEIIIMTIYL